MKVIGQKGKKSVRLSSGGFFPRIQILLLFFVFTLARAIVSIGSLRGVNEMEGARVSGFINPLGVNYRCAAT